MVVHGLELRELDDHDVADSVLLSKRSFGFPATDTPPPDRFGGGATRHGAFLGGRLVGQAFDLHDEQWWGGRLLEAADIGGVAVAAEARGHGLARTLIGALLARAKERGAVVSALYPSISTVYRALGWATTGQLVTVALPTLALPRSPIPTHIEVREGTVDDLADVHEVYRSVAVTGNGMLSRDEERLRTDGLPRGVDGLTVAVVADQVVGYYLWTRGQHYGDKDSVLTVHELLAATPEAAQALFTVMATWHTVVPTVRLCLLDGDIVADLLPLELGQVHKLVRWMHRPVDIAVAVSGRGWPTGVHGRALFSMEDKLAPWNTGTWSLTVDGGVGQLRRSKLDTSVHLSVAGFASLYCGLTTVDALRQAGHVSGQREDATALDVLATSAPPRMLDTF
ncbi:MAG TPA: GNAT family N-acetyltransferase [Pseudonocardiaceae bacterium]|nr:GNAT family N-acetyltransferase [Pseudonocardiaceae bacterium]